VSSSPAPLTLSLLWGMFFPSHALFLAIPFLVPMEAQPFAAFAPLLAVPAVIAGGLAAEGSLPARFAAAAQTFFILRFALSELAALLGLAACLVTGGDHLVQAGCALVGLVAHTLSYPSVGAIEAHAAQHRR